MKRFTCVVVLCLVAGCRSEAKPELIPLEKLPDGVLKTAQETLPKVKFEQAIRRPDGGFEVRGKDAAGKIRDVEFSQDGKVLEIE